MNIDVVRASANSAYKNYIRGEYPKFINDMDTFYKAGKSNPTVADIILGDTIRQGLVQTAKDHEIMNEKILQLPNPKGIVDSMARSSTEIKALTSDIASMAKAIRGRDLLKDIGLNFLNSKEEYDKNFNKMYPKTAKTRKMFTNNGFISPDKTTPKLSWTQKICLGAVRDYKKLYPKTLYLRVSNILSGRIVDDKVTPKLKTLPRPKTKFDLTRKGIKL